MKIFKMNEDNMKIFKIDLDVIKMRNKKCENEDCGKQFDASKNKFNKTLCKCPDCGFIQPIFKQHKMKDYDN